MFRCKNSLSNPTTDIVSILCQNLLTIKCAYWDHNYAFEVGMIAWMANLNQEY